MRFDILQLCCIDCSITAGTEGDRVIVIYAAVGLFSKECHPFIMIQDSGLTSCRTRLALAGTGILGESEKNKLTKYNILPPSELLSQSPGQLEQVAMVDMVCYLQTEEE